jgi:drug/metabolite transporter (DMT)-like permease
MATPVIVRKVAASPAAHKPTSHTPAVPSQLKGILLLVGSTVFFSVSDIITKQLAFTLPAGEVAWMRYVVFALLLIPLLLMNGGRTLLRTQRPGLQFFRGLGMVGSTIMFIHGLRFLPVADATAIYFISPIVIMALSILFLGETVGWRRWTAAAVGLLGVVIVIRPGTGAFQTASFLPLMGATSWAAAAVFTRKMSGSEHPLTTLAYSALVGLVLLSAGLPFSWEMPNGTELALGVCVGVLSTIGHWFVILAYRHATASTIAPFSYVQLIWSGALGYVVFSAMPDSLTIVGACIIAASGLYTAYRERVRAMEKKASA